MLALMGPARTKQAVILASLDRIGSAEALDWGLVEKVVDDGHVLAASMAFAERIALQPPIPVRMSKASVNRLAHALDDLAAHMDADQNVLTGLTEDYREGNVGLPREAQADLQGALAPVPPPPARGIGWVRAYRAPDVAAPMQLPSTSSGEPCRERCNATRSRPVLRPTQGRKAGQLGLPFDWLSTRIIDHDHRRPATNRDDCIEPGGNTSAR